MLSECVSSMALAQILPVYIWAYFKAAGAKKHGYSVAASLVAYGAIPPLFYPMSLE